MADRFPLIVNPISKKIEELVDGDNLELTGNGIIINGDTGVSGEYLKSTGTGLIWDRPGDVYLTATQTLTNKTFQSCTISGSNNVISNIPNSSLINSIINVNGAAIPLGGSVTTPDNNTTYSISAIDGTSGTEKIIRLTSGGNFGSGVNDDVKLIAGDNVTLSRTNDSITINSSFVDTNTVTRLQSAVGGALVSGDITIAAAGSSTVSQTGSIITISSTFTDTVTRLRAGTGQTLASGDFTFLQGGATTVTQDGGEITISSLNTITRVRGGGTSSFNTGDITIVGSGASTVSQDGSTITVNSVDTNTVTRIRGTTGGTYVTGDVTFTSSGASTVFQTGNTINISSVNTDTTYTASASGGLSLSGTEFLIKNSANFTDSKLQKWDNSNKQFVNSIINDDGSTVTIEGNFVVSGTTTTLNTQTLIVADNEIELRRGNNLVGADGGIRLNRTTSSLGAVQTYTSLQWFESGGFWRVFDGSVSRRLVTENETQTLTNKTLSSPTLVSPTLGIATATTINGLTITSTASGVLTIADAKTLRANNTVTFFGTDGSTLNYRTGGTVAYTADTLASFANTTSAQLRGVISDSTGFGVLVFNQSPSFTDSILTASATFSVVNTTATTVNAFGAATTITIGANGTGTTTIRNSLTVAKNVTLGETSTDTLIINGTPDFRNSDVIIRGNSLNPFRIGRGGGAIPSNTSVGYASLQNNSSGSQNTSVGFESGFAVNSGAANTMYGYRALRNLSTGSFNTVVGRDSASNLINGNRNVSVGSNALTENQSGNANVCIGHYAGYNCLGTGNVIIGPADDENSTNATYQPPTVSGNRQLVVGSGTGTWIRGNEDFNVTLPQSVTVGGSLVVGGNLTINGSSTTINSAVLSVDDKNIEMGAVQDTTFTANTLNNNANISAITPTSNLIPGMVVSVTSAGISVPGGTFIVSITGNTAVLSNPVSGTGNATFIASGPTNDTANGGGIILKGTTDKSILWTNATSAWTASENFDLATGKQYRIGNVLIASGSQIGPSTGSFALGAGVTTSSLTSVGTLSSLSIASSGTAVGLTITNTGTGDCLVVNDESGDTTPFKIDNAGAIYINNNIVDTTGSTGSTNQLLTRRSTGGVEWKGLNTLTDPNTVTNAGTSTDNAIARFDLTTGKIIQNSLATIDDTGNLNIPTGQSYQINGTSVLSGSALGSGITSSSLTSVGTLTSLTVTGSIAANGGVNVATGQAYQINGTSVLTNNTLGSGVTSSSLTTVGTLTGLTVNGTTNLKQITETSVNNFTSTLSPSTGTLTVDTSAATVVLGDLDASVTTWAFTNVPAVNNKATTVTLIIDGDTAQTYGDACSVNGTAITNGVKWAGGVAPDATNNYDILTFTIVRDGAGTINVFGSGTVNFS
jgi:hypothetical protein